MAIDGPVGELNLFYSGNLAANGGSGTWGFSSFGMSSPGLFSFSFANSVLQPGTGIGGSFALCGVIAGCGGSFDKGPFPPSMLQLSAERSSGSFGMGVLKEASNTI